MSKKIILLSVIVIISLIGVSNYISLSNKNICKLDNIKSNKFNDSKVYFEANFSNYILKAKNPYDIDSADADLEIEDTNTNTVCELGSVWLPKLVDVFYEGSKNLIFMIHPVTANSSAITVINPVDCSSKMVFKWSGEYKIFNSVIKTNNYIYDNSGIPRIASTSRYVLYGDKCENYRNLNI
jgi:hypothetical protein